MTSYDANLFTVLGETLNLHRTAERLHVSPQYVSRRIADLEREYDVKLFYRKPCFSLSYEGELLLQAIRDIQMYERNLESELQDLCPPQNPELHLGYNGESIGMILPDLLVEYHKLHPEARVFVVEQPEETLLAMLEDSQLDLCFGIKSSAHNMESFPLPNEEIFLLVPDGLLRRAFPNDYPLCAERFYRGVHLEDFASLPFLDNLSERKLSQQVWQYSLDHSFLFHYVLSSVSIDALISLCQQGLGCLVCTARHLHRQLLASRGHDQYTYHFPVLDLMNDYHMNIFYSKKRRLPRYMIEFIHCAKTLFELQTPVDINARER